MAAAGEAASKGRACERPTGYASYTEGAPRIALVLTPFDDANLALATQIGATDVVYYDMGDMPRTAEALLAARKRAESYGLRMSCVEGGPVMDKIVSFVEGDDPSGRDEQIREYIACIEAMGEAGIPILCYNFMPWAFRVGRTSYEVPIRGGALSSEWRMEQFDDSPVEGHEAGPSVEQMWANYKHFLEAVVPACERSGVYLAVHPDDPPLARIKGLNRIMNTPEAFERMLQLVDSPHNGLAFCQGCFSEMGVDVPATIRRLGHRTHFVHFRDVQGSADNFVETFQDDGQTDMHATLRAWKEIKFNGIIRPDHVPLLPSIEEGHDVGFKARGYFSGKASGYTMVGRVWAVGYLRGLMDSVYGEQASHKATCLKATEAAAE